LALLFFCGGRAAAQAAQEGRTVETINVTEARPVASAMDVIEERYGVLIDYVDPQYAAPQDIESVSYRPGRITPIPRIRTISLQYAQVAGRPEGVPYISCNADTLGCAPVTTRPEGGITALIEQVLSQFAGQGGQAFRVQKVEMPYGPRWEVYPEEARDRSGRFVFQPDVLSANIFIPKEQRTLGGVLGLICQQLTTKWGHKFGIAWAPLNRFSLPAGELGADNVPARRALADLMGRTLVLRLFYDPDDGEYAVNIVNLPYREPPRPPTPAPVPARVLPPAPRPPGYWLIRARTREGILEIQGGLAKAGYLHTAPTTQWDAEATAALRQFQAAVGFPPTGEFDYWTASKLAPFLPQYQEVLPARSPMDLALAYWLQSTPRGRMEIQQALTKAGFYSGPTTGALDLKTRDALKAFQTANGLTPTGFFDHETAEKLAPFLPEP
jgi:hypothetical protein